MNAIDLVMLLPLGLAFIRGYRKGFILGIFTAIALIAAIIACMKVTTIVLGWVQAIVGPGPWLPFFAYLLTFIGAFFIVLWLGKIIEKMVQLAALGWINKLSGAGLSVLKACFIISLFFWLLDRVSLLPESAKEGSFTYRNLNGFAPKVIDKVSAWVPWMKSRVKDFEDHFESTDEEHTA